MADIVIFYELPERELNNANLLKAEFERRGYTVEIMGYWDYKNVIHPMEDKPKLVIAHSGYDDSDLERFTVRFKSKIDKMVNLRYEQVMAKKVTDSTLHFPRENMRNMCCVCWSEEIKKQMINKGFPEENLCVTGDIKTDFSHKKFDSFYKSKEELAKEFNLDINKEWILFISSFTFKEDDTDYHLTRYNENYEDGKYLQKWDIGSKNILLKWIKKFLESHPEKEFIYRPHPAENNNLEKDQELCNLIKEFDNFHYIKQYAIQEWIRPCEFLNTISSTSIVDAYLQKKQCNILRPVALDEDFDNPLFKHANFITDYEDFEQNNLEKGNVFPISDEDVSKYYYFGDKLAYENICDFAEKIINDDSYKADFYPNGFKFSRSKFFIKKAFTLPKVIPNAFKLLFKFSKDSNAQNTTSSYAKNAEKIKEIVFNEDV